ncbi:tetratricopeptide repeat protein [Oscillatoriales cyanobacterium LEGE 11467]|uniref:Tetratricopeptide repeat protein n=1 Tax=Zarconia navalis LEGE 11467 TaxID=1828826 RepID=A0A928VXG6_9CYAN|nr:tetratricopeptide repeat protein [Zarconia navalis]MBE9039465.1 tetratricopeptide repeat protein [Zarconia navalis LEGE 11467]
MRLSSLKSIAVVLAMLLVATNTVSARVQAERQLVGESQTARADVSPSVERGRDRLGSTLVGLALLPVFGGASVGLLLHLLEKRAQGYLRQLNTLENRAISQTDALATEARVAIDEIRSYLDRPFDKTIASPRSDGYSSSSTHPVSPELHRNPTGFRRGESVNVAPVSSALDREPTHANSHPSARAPDERTTGRTYLDVCDRPTPTRDNRAGEDCAQGNHLFLEARYAEAIVAYDRAIQRCGSYHQAWCNRGSAFFQLEQYERALSDTDRALALQPDYAEAWNNRGTILAKLKRTPEALISYNKALRLQPKYPDAWINRGLVLVELGQYGEALFAYTKAAEYQSGDRDLWFYRAQAFVALEQYSNALDALDRALELQRSQPKFFYCKATCYALQGNIDLALKNLQQAILLGSDSGFKFENYRARAQTEPAFTSLGNDPRFQQLVGHPSLD